MPDITFVVASAVACAIAFLVWWGERRAQRAHDAWCAGATRTTGVVSRIGVRGYLSKNEPTSGTRLHTVPVVRFKAGDGVEYEIDAPDAPRKVGESVDVAYDPALPSDARVPVRRAKGGCAIVFVLLAIAAAVRAFVEF